ncbi:hypothetical protein [Actinomadura roseirufa]|uniref:hypothetical protein n=1 Tax=Actinomadura roseirufa TaxID=2094049 RepID=UPI001F5E7FE0|nr:hypothetical protein [Actinomadura roseirufa]
MVSDGGVGYLEELEHELDTRGLVARVVRTRSGPAFLRVVNPEAASLAEDVTCAPAPESPDHYFWWSWGELMHRVDDPGGAAVKLAHVLQPLLLDMRERDRHERDRHEARDGGGRRDPRERDHRDLRDREPCERRVGRS